MTKPTDTTTPKIRGWQFYKRTWGLVAPYWTRSNEKVAAWTLLLTIVGMALGLVYLNVLFNEWNNTFYNALQNMDVSAFWHQMLRFCWLAGIFIVVAVYQTYLQQMLQIKWRKWLTDQYVQRYAGQGRAYYRLTLKPYGTDNPDQRISQDLNDLSGTTLSLGLGLLSSVVTLVSFVHILWSLSGPLAFALGGHHIVIPGYMVWVALVYAAAGSWLTYKVGRPLVNLNFFQQKYEANFRFDLMRVRENAEGIALYKGEDEERAGLTDSFKFVKDNWWSLMKYNKRLSMFTVGYNQAAIIFPFVVAAPRYFAKAIGLGGLMQISSAFGQVQGALSWFVGAYSTVASWQASINRLVAFHDAMDMATAEAEREDGIKAILGKGRTLTAADLKIELPDGTTLVDGANLTITAGDRVLFAGPSGSGKSTLFRVLAGIWPYGKGKVTLPEGARIMFLPQKPYMPIGTLAEAVAYPLHAAAFDREAMAQALRDVRLEGLAGRLDDIGHWGQQLSPGEQQRLAVARALLHQPEWLFLDEATAALDEPTEGYLYQLMTKRLPKATFISIAHRTALKKYHTRKVELLGGKLVDQGAI